jgi:hypothetical protein
LLIAGPIFAQQLPPSPPAAPQAAASPTWNLAITVDGYLIRNGNSYVNPSVAADYAWLHLEARYNYENLRTGSFWAGYNFSTGKKLVLEVTPMVGGVVGRTTGVAPGCEATLTYKRIEVSLSAEYVFDLRHKSESFYSDWPEVTYSPKDWLRVGLVAQHDKAFQTKLNTQFGFLVGFSKKVSKKRIEFTTYVFNPGQSNLTFVLEAGWRF